MIWHKNSETIFTNINKKEALVSKENQPLIWFGRTDADAGAPAHWPTDVKSRFTGRGPDLGEDGRQEETGITEDEMVRWHHRLNGHEFEQPLGDNERQGSLVCCSPLGLRVGHDLVTEQCL